MEHFVKMRQVNPFSKDVFFSRWFNLKVNITNQYTSYLDCCYSSSMYKKDSLISGGGRSSSLLVTIRLRIVSPFFTKFLDWVVNPNCVLFSKIFLSAGPWTRTPLVYIFLEFLCLSNRESYGLICRLYRFEWPNAFVSGVYSSSLQSALRLKFLSLEISS